MKRLSALILVLVMMLAALPALAVIEYEGDPRIVPEGEDVTLTIFQSLSPIVESLDRDNNKATQIIEEATGLKLEFVSALAADAETKLNLLLNSGDYPYIISWETGLSKAEMDAYAKEGIFVPLDDYISPEKTPNTIEMFAYSDAIRSYVTGSDGLIYSMPGFNEAFHCLYGEGRAWYNMPFMTAYEKGLPNTTAELMDYLKWIRDEDVNGNGDPSDENPLVFPAVNTDRFIRWVSNFYQIHPFENYRVNVSGDGKVEACFTTPEYKMALQFAHDLYAEDLILKDSFSISVDDLRAIGENPNGTTNAVIIGWGPEDGVVKAGTTKRWFEYFAMPPGEGENGQRNAIFNANYSTRQGFYVTDACPEEYRQYAVQLGDLLLDEYYGYTTYIGPKGVSWDDPSSPDALGINGEPAWFRELVAYGTQETNSSWDQRSITNRYAAFRLGQEAEGADVILKYLDGDATLKEQASSFGSYNEVMKYYACQKNLDPYAFDPEWCVPTLLYADDIADQATDAETAVNTHRNEMIAAFVTGARSLDEYDQYVKELNDMGLETVLDAKNAALEVIKK